MLMPEDIAGESIHHVIFDLSGSKHSFLDSQSADERRPFSLHLTLNDYYAYILNNKDSYDNNECFRSLVHPTWTP